MSLLWISRLCHANVLNNAGNNFEMVALLSSHKGKYCDCFGCILSVISSGDLVLCDYKPELTLSRKNESRSPWRTLVVCIK